MEILEAYDLIGSFRQAAALVGCDHKTVAHWVGVREATGGAPPARAKHRRPVADPFGAKVDELVDRSRGQIGADQAHSKLVAMGYEGSERTTRRAVAEAKRRWRQKHGRRTRPWIPEPGLWLQWDYGDGPVIAGARTVLFCAWLAWSRYRVVVPLRDKTLPSVVIGLDRTLRRVDGVPTYALTDNEKTVTVEHVCGIAVRNPQIVEVSRHYGLTIATCEPADPQSKGGSENTVKIAKADLVPTSHNLRDEYEDFAALEDACEQFMAEVNTRAHRVTRRPPAEMLAEEHEHLHRLPRVPHTLCFGQTRKVNWQSLISVGGALYSVPHQLIDERVWARTDGSELIVVHVDGHLGPKEVARHRLTTPGRPAINDEHYPPRPAGALERKPRARGDKERAFLALGDGAEAWLIKAAAQGAQDAKKLVSLYRAGMLRFVHPPTPELEGLRDLLRARDDLRGVRLAARNRVLKQLLRHGRIFREGKTAWTKLHRAWLARQHLDDLLAQEALEQLLIHVDGIERQLDTLDARLQEIAGSERWGAQVQILTRFRGIATITALGLIAEIGDFARFSHPRELAAWLGIVPSEYSSGDQQHRGHITLSGNKHARRLLIEAAWHYRHAPRLPKNGPPPDERAWQAQVRLHHRHRHLTDHGKRSTVANVAVARELVGFLWAAVTNQPLRATHDPSAVNLDQLQEATA